MRKPTYLPTLIDTGVAVLIAFGIVALLFGNGCAVKHASSVKQVSRITNANTLTEGKSK